jgi:hypothetical protein
MNNHQIWDNREVSPFDGFAWADSSFRKEDCWDITFKTAKENIKIDNRRSADTRDASKNNGNFENDAVNWLAFDTLPKSINNEEWNVRKQKEPIENPISIAPDGFFFTPEEHFTEKKPASSRGQQSKQQDKKTSKKRRENIRNVLGKYIDEGKDERGITPKQTDDQSLKSGKSQNSRDSSYTSQRKSCRGKDLLGNFLEEKGSKQEATIIKSTEDGIVQRVRRQRLHVDEGKDERGITPKQTDDRSLKSGRSQNSRDNSYTSQRKSRRGKDLLGNFLEQKGSKEATIIKSTEDGIVQRVRRQRSADCKQTKKEVSLKNYFGGFVSPKPAVPAWAAESTEEEDSPFLSPVTHNSKVSASLFYSGRPPKTSIIVMDKNSPVGGDDGMSGWKLREQAKYCMQEQRQKSKRALKGNNKDLLSSPTTPSTLVSMDTDGIFFQGSNDINAPIPETATSRPSSTRKSGKDCPPPADLAWEIRERVEVKNSPVKSVRLLGKLLDDDNDSSIRTNSKEWDWDQIRTITNEPPIAPKEESGCFASPVVHSSKFLGRPPSFQPPGRRHSTAQSRSRSEQVQVLLAPQAAPPGQDRRHSSSEGRPSAGWELRERAKNRFNDKQMKQRTSLQSRKERRSAVKEALCWNLDGEDA